MKDCMFEIKEELHLADDFAKLVDRFEFTDARKKRLLIFVRQAVMEKQAPKEQGQ